MVALLALAGTAAADGAKTVQVRGYTKKDGTYVRPHTRSAPGTSGTVVVAPPPVEYRTEARTAPRTEPPAAGVPTKPAAEKKAQVRLAVAIVLKPADRQAIYLGATKYHAATAVGTPDVRSKWVAAGDLVALDAPAEVVLTEWDRDFSRVTHAGREWYVVGSHVRKPEPSAESAPGVGDMPAVTVGGGGGVVPLGTSKYVAVTAGKSAEVRAKWEREGDLRLIDKPTRAGLLAREPDCCRVLIDGREWYVETKHVSDK